MGLLYLFLLPSLAQELDVGRAQTEKLCHTARTHLHSTSCTTRQAGCNVQALLVHVYEGYIQANTLSNNHAILQSIYV